MKRSERFRPCAVVPVFDHPRTVERVVEGIRRYLDDVIVVDDGSGEETAAVLDRMASSGHVVLFRHFRNRGKGAAVDSGLRVAAARGFSHALQVDADGQHEIEDIPKLLAVAEAHPEAVVLGQPLFDASAPRSRRIARFISKFWVDLETGGGVIADPLCGFRVYPVAAAVAAGARAERMGYDPEIAVRLYWMGAEIINVPTRVRYLREDEGGVSHYRMFWDNVEMSRVHSRLSTQALPRLVLRALRRRWGGEA